MFSFFKPSTAVIDEFISTSSKGVFSYPEIGATRRDKPPGGYTVDHNRINLGSGDDVWEQAKEAIRGWKMFDFPWIDLYWPNTPIVEYENVAILISHLGLYSLNAARIVYTIDEPDRFGFAYGTLQSHAESGEERFSVERAQSTGDVWYDLYAFSRPNYLFAKLGYPYTRSLQKRFAVGSKAAMAGFINSQE